MDHHKPALFPQYFATFSACLGGLAMGTSIGFSSPAGPLFTNGTDETIQLTEEQNGYFGSVLNVGALLGGPLAGFLIGTIGRKSTMIFSIMPFLLGWGLVAGSQNYAMLMVGRITTGLCCGLTSMTVPTYIGEFSSPNIRGTLASGFQIFVTIGVLYAYLLGPIMSDFRWIAIVCAFPSLVYCAFMIFSKESPTFLLMKNKDQEASKALQYFRGPNYNISKELESLKATIEEEKRNKKTIKDLNTPYILKPLLISIAIMLFQQLSGINAVIFNLSLIFEAAGTGISENLSAIIIGVLQVVATIVGGVLCDRAGRRLLLIVSGAAMALSLVALGFYFYELENYPEVAKMMGWLPLLSLSVYIIAFSIGYGPMPWIVMGEIFSSDIRGPAASIATFSNWTTAFIVTLLYQPLSSVIYDFGVYWIFAAICIVNVAFCFFILIETKGKTIQEITAIFGGPSPPLPEPEKTPNATL